jgi:hypothetical protein
VWHFAQGAEPVDQGLLEGSRGGGRLASTRQMPAQQLARAAIDH